MKNTQMKSQKAVPSSLWNPRNLPPDHPEHPEYEDYLTLKVLKEAAARKQNQPSKK